MFHIGAGYYRTKPCSWAPLLPTSTIPARGSLWDALSGLNASTDPIQYASQSRMAVCLVCLIF